MAVPEYHTTITYNSDTYYARNLIMSDKAFFLETFADFPTENPNVDNERLFEKLINKWLEHLLNPNAGYLPIIEGWEAYPNNIYLKNDVAFGIQYADLVWEGSNFISRNSTIAIHPDFRGQGLTAIINGHGQYWTYSDEAQLPTEETYYEMPHSNITGRQHQKDRNYSHTGSRTANTFGTRNTAPVTHSFYHTKEQRYDYTPGATYEIVLHEYDFTNARYGTDYVTSGDRDRFIAETNLSWDRDL